MKRPQFVTKTGAIAATVGSAVGLGNIWRFPYELGANGGGAFLLVYIISVLLVGFPVMLSEFVIGRATHKNSRAAIKELLPKSALHNMSYLSIVCSVLLISFYSVVGSWVMCFLIQSLGGYMVGHTVTEYNANFGWYLANPYLLVGGTLVYMFVNYLILSRGIVKGIERASNVMMPLLFLLLVVFCVNAMMMPKAGEGLEFMFKPDFSALTPSVVLQAMGQAFFSLSLGLSCVLTYASFFSDDDSLLRNAGVVMVLDTMVALLAGVMIFPVIFSFGAEPAAGPKLVFEVLPNIFQQLPGAYFWAVAFFLLLFFACVTSSVSMLEIPITFLIEETGISRRKAVGIASAIACVLGALCALSFNVLSGCTLFGKSIFDLFDYATSNIFMPLGGLLFTVIVGWLIDKRILESQLTNGGVLRVPRWLLFAIRVCIRYVAPAAIIVIFLYCLGVIG